jgi:hypothetical protein
MNGETLRVKICRQSRSAAKFEFGPRERSDLELFSLAETIIARISRAMGVPKRGTFCLTHREPVAKRKKLDVSSDAQGSYMSFGEKIPRERTRPMQV